MPEARGRIEILGAEPLLQMAGWAGFASAAAAALDLGERDLPTAGLAANRGATILYWVAPDRLWIRGAAPMPAQTRDLCLLDLTQSRRLIRIVHPDLSDAAERFLTVDARPRAWPVGAVRQTQIHGVGVLTHRRDDRTLDILVPATWAASLADYLSVVLQDCHMI